MQRIRIQWSDIVRAICGVSLLCAFAGSARAGLTDLTQTPNPMNEGINKSLEQQIGTGRGSLYAPQSSRYIIARDPFRSVRRGRQIFQRKFTMAQGLGPRSNDGIGDNIHANAALGAGVSDSCAGCHGRPRGAAGFGGDVFTRPDSRDAPHLFGLGIQEMLGDEMTTDLRAQRARAMAEAHDSGHAVRVRLRSKGIEFGTLVAQPNGAVDLSGIDGVDRDLRVKPFFAQGGTFNIRQFVVGAFNDEMGLQSPDPDLLAAAQGQRVVTPSGMVLDGRVDTLPRPPARNDGEDPDGDRVANEIDPALVDHMEFYLLNYFKPAVAEETTFTSIGRRLMSEMGCTSCHRPTLVIEHDRRVADVETRFDAERGNFNRLFATATPLFHEVDDNRGLPALRMPNRARFEVHNIYADMKRHDLGPKFWERNFDGSFQKEFMTEALWGVGSTAPYGHDGRSINLHEVILRHGGEAQAARDRYVRFGAASQLAVREFLQSLIIFPPDDTASNLNPGDRTVPNFPQRGHGGIRLPALFLDPTDLE